jgi:hypothetical protein
MNLPLKKKPQNEPKVQIPEPPKPKIEPVKQRQEPQKSKPEPPKPKVEAPKKIIINNDINKKPVNDLQKSPSIDETPISVSQQRKNFEKNRQNEVPKVQTIPATPKTPINSPWNRSQQQTVPTPAPEPEKKKKIIIKQRSKDVVEEPPKEQPKRRSTKDLVEAIERVNSPTTATNDDKPYRRRQTSQLDDNKSKVSNSIGAKPVENTQPIRRRTKELVAEPQPPPPPPPPTQPFVSSRTIKLNKGSPSPSPTPSTNKSPQPPVSHSPSPTPYEKPAESMSSQQSKMVFGRVPPPRLSISGRTLSQASQNISDVSNKVTNNDSTTSSISGRSASNSRSESPVLPAVVKTNHIRDKTDTKTDTKTVTKTETKDSKPDNKLSDNLVAKRAAVSLKKQLPVQKSSSSSEEETEESSEEELDDNKNKPKVSTLSMQLSSNNKNINNNKLINNKNNNKEPEIMQNNVSELTQTQPKEPSIDNQVVNRVSLAQTKDRQQSFDRKLEKSKSGLTRSSTAKILNLIKTKSRHDLGLERVEEDDEIESLLMGLEKEGIENVDWDELGVDYEEVKDIVEGAKTGDSNEHSDEDSDEDSSDDEDSDSDDEEAVHMVINRQAPQEKESEESDDEFEVVEDEEEEESD